MVETFSPFHLPSEPRALAVAPEGVPDAVHKVPQPLGVLHQQVAGPEPGVALREDVPQHLAPLRTSFGPALQVALRRFEARLMELRPSLAAARRRERLTATSHACSAPPATGSQEQWDSWIDIALDRKRS